MLRCQGPGGEGGEVFSDARDDASGTPMGEGGEGLSEEEWAMVEREEGEGGAEVEQPVGVSAGVVG